jgi:hypothetical protein
MRMYIFLNKELIRKLAPKVYNVSFDIDFFEYSEKKGYSQNINTCIRPEVENGCRRECSKENIEKRNKLDVSKDSGVLCNYEVIKRYVNIEDISIIKNNKFYYSIVEKINQDDRIKIKNGVIDNLNRKFFYIENNKFIINEEVYNLLQVFFENNCSIQCVGYKINCLEANFDVFEVIAIYIE